MGDGIASSFIKKIFQRGSSNQEPSEEVKVGDKFFQVGGTESHWVVERLFKPTISDVPHVVVTRQGAHPTSKIISLSALHDADVFRPERRDPVNVDNEKKAKARRRTDTSVTK